MSRVIVQIGGTGFACSVEALRKVSMQDESLVSRLFEHEQIVYAQAQQSVACMAAHPLEMRLARWLLRARDLSGSDQLPFTQEFLAEMLGAQRTSVSLVAHTLQQAGMIKYSRGKIQIINLEALLECACECYGAIQSRYERLLGS